MLRRSVLASLAAGLATPVFSGKAVAQGLQPAAPLGLIKVTMTTGEGPILLELNGDKAPLTVANFLRYVEAGRYNRSFIYRAMKAPGMESGLVQGGARPVAGRQIPPVVHEPTTQTGLLHTDGTISLARMAPGTGTSDFFICVGDAPYLDARPDAPGDNLGFAAFGRVLEGMDIARRILTLPTSQEAENPVMKGQMLSPPVPILTTVRTA
jgi:peptidyl-prolyl cis-trans isomerase A (cyclophilin A)